MGRGARRVFLIYLNLSFVRRVHSVVNIREEEFAYQYRVPAKHLMGEKITGTNDFAKFSMKIAWTRGRGPKKH